MARDFFPGIGQAVAERTILRKKPVASDDYCYGDGSPVTVQEWEEWKDVAERVAQGNAMIAPTAKEKVDEFGVLNRLIGKGALITSGRHLQHGDLTQPSRNMEVFTNCSTAATSFASAYLLLNGSGVGRCYDDDLMVVDWDNAPSVLCVLDSSHPDFDPLAHESVRDAKHKYAGKKNVIWHDVQDSREGWAAAIELYELLAFEKIHKDKLLILNFSPVRKRNSPIGGMQGRPASGPVPLMNAFARVATLKGAGMDPWKQAMYVDHYFAECVLVGGVRRSARMSVKYWKDPSIFEFIEIKRPIEFQGLTGEEVQARRKQGWVGSFLWSSNNSVGVDAEFWELVKLGRKSKKYRSDLAKHARKVYARLVECAYFDGTGEPGVINLDKLVKNDAGLNAVKGEYLKSDRYEVRDGTHLMMDRILRIAKAKQYYMIVNPCSEIALALWGAFCTIADVCFFHCDTVAECEETVRAAVRFLIRVNKLNSIYDKEVKRTNRIGVGLTGVHEAAWKLFGLAFRDLIDEDKSQEFWQFLNRMKRAVRDEAVKYSKLLGVTTPHTDTTIKPSGSVSKLFGLTEGWHLPSMAWYLRWVQFRNDDPLIQQYAAQGYPTRKLVGYKDTTIVGFPTVPLVAQLIPADKLVTAGEATPEEQYRWLLLGEKYWIRGVGDDGSPLLPDTGNQISYTLKYNPEKVSFKEFSDTFLRYQSQVRCCSVMPQADGSSYEYLPEQPVSQAEYVQIMQKIEESVSGKVLTEEIGREHLDCGTGGCPIDFNAGSK